MNHVMPTSYRRPVPIQATRSTLIKKLETGLRQDDAPSLSDAELVEDAVEEYVIDKR